MKHKIYFKLLFFFHRIKQVLGLKDKSNHVIKIWSDHKKQNTYIYVNRRSGCWYMPIERRCNKKQTVYSNWLAEVKMTDDFGLPKTRTIYSLYETRTELIQGQQ